MKFRWGEKILVAIVFLSLAISLGCYWKLPEQITVGWGGSDWQPMQSGPKFLGTFLFSILMTVLFLPYFLFTRFKKRADDKRYTYYDQLLVWLFAFYFCFQLYVVFWNFGYRIQVRPERLLLPFLGLLFFALGETFAHAEQDWFISLGNRFTRRNKIIWKKTHEAAGKWLKVAGVAGLLGLVLPFRYAVYPTAVFGTYALICPFIACLKLRHTDADKRNT